MMMFLFYLEKEKIRRNLHKRFEKNEKRSGV